MRVVDPEYTTKRSNYTWSYLCSSTWLKSRNFAYKCYKSGPSNLSTTGGFMPVIFSIYLMHPHLGPPAFSV